MQAPNYERTQDILLDKQRLNVKMRLLVCLALRIINALDRLQFAQVRKYAVGTIYLPLFLLFQCHAQDAEVVKGRQVGRDSTQSPPNILHRFTFLLLNIDEYLLMIFISLPVSLVLTSGYLVPTRLLATRIRSIYIKKNIAKLNESEKKNFFVLFFKIVSG